MTHEEFDNIKRVIKNYKSKKNDLLEKRNDIESQLRDNKITPWQGDLLIDDLYKEFEETQERNEFNQLAQKATKDNKFEKYFRAAHLQVFFNINLNPESL
ncbi:hypothetical protein R9C00_04575 [Flammeovirgaceae bacterium SG7u.111]|nr:hypothetical protein [Flammeovirgaceae bacterium SG7u.132]WPO36721.1 hypothetical protein R9C00_04575 [Flammeovirgaceae bacterium SG7u.111]